MYVDNTFHLLYIGYIYNLFHFLYAVKHSWDDGIRFGRICNIWWGEEALSQFWRVAIHYPGP